MAEKGAKRDKFFQKYFGETPWRIIPFAQSYIPLKPQAFIHKILTPQTEKDLPATLASGVFLLRNFDEVSRNKAVEAIGKVDARLGNCLSTLLSDTSLNSEEMIVASAMVLARTEETSAIPVRHEPRMEDVLNYLGEDLRQIVAFGEIHDRVIPAYEDNMPETFRSTLDYFAEEILPEMVKKGYEYLVLEFPPHDVPQSEIEFYITNGFITPEQAPLMWKAFYLSGGIIPLFQENQKMRFSFCEKIRENILSLRATGYSITLTGGHLSVEDYQYLNTHFQTYSTNRTLRPLTLQVGKNTGDKVEEILSRDPNAKIITYNGAYHNDPHRPQYFGGSLPKDNITAIDLDVPEITAMNTFVTAMPRRERREDRNAVQVASPDQLALFRMHNGNWRIVAPMTLLK